VNVADPNTLAPVVVFPVNVDLVTVQPKSEYNPMPLPDRVQLLIVNFPP